MAANEQTVLVQVGKATFKVQREELPDYLKRHPGAKAVEAGGASQPDTRIQETEPVPISQMTVAQLRDLASEWEVDVPSKILRDDLVALMEAEEARRAEPAGDDDSSSLLVNSETVTGVVDVPKPADDSGQV